MTKRDPEPVLREVAASAEGSPGGTLAASICDRVRADILAGRRKPGARIRLEDLKAEFSVSWSPIREALSRLVAEGLITTEESRGYRIAPVSSADLAEVIRLRVLLEPMALERSIENGDDAWEAEVLAHQHRLGKVESKRFSPGEAEQWERWHRAYHEALIAACGAPILHPAAVLRPVARSERPLPAPVPLGSRFRPRCSRRAPRDHRGGACTRRGHSV